MENTIVRKDDDMNVEMHDINKNYIDRKELPEELLVAQNNMVDISNSMISVINDAKDQINSQKNVYKEILETPIFGMSEKEKNKFISDGERLLSKIDKQEKALDAIYDSFQNHIEDSDKDWETVDNMNPENLKSRDKAKVIKYLNSRKEFSKGNKRKEDSYDKLIQEIQNSYELNNLKSTIKKMKNPQKIYQNYEANFETTYKKFFKLLSELPKFVFTPPTEVLNILENFMYTEDAKLFLYFLMDGANNKAKIKDKAVFIDNFIKNVYALESGTLENSEESNTLLVNIEEVVNMLKSV